MRRAKQCLILSACGLAFYALQIFLWIRSISHGPTRVAWPAIIGSCLLIAAGIVLAQPEHKRTFRH